MGFLFMVEGVFKNLNNDENLWQREKVERESNEKITEHASGGNWRGEVECWTMVVADGTEWGEREGYRVMNLLIPKMKDYLIILILFLYIHQWLLYIFIYSQWLLYKSIILGIYCLVIGTYHPMLSSKFKMK